ncbi:hypothetical protein GF377_05615 [candidate division GN15 bacterium]|nr:hypothetical protein [candidate division GN15 bacterium]
MNKTFRLLQLINLLAHRRTVTLEMIKQTCDIPERTAYRYLNAISEVDIPVYFDKDLRAYCLTDASGTGVEDLSTGDAVLVVAALKLLKRFVNEEYQKDIDKLLTKLLVRQDNPVEEALPIVDDHLEEIDASDSLSELLSSALIHTAITANRKVRVDTRKGDDKDRSLTISSPALFFKNGWQLHERQTADGLAAPVGQIRKVKII